MIGGGGWISTYTHDENSCSVERQAGKGLPWTLTFPDSLHVSLDRSRFGWPLSLSLSSFPFVHSLTHKGKKWTRSHAF